MGICLSCLYSNEDIDDELNERSSLLRNRHLYSNDYLHEEELLKQQQRQQELNNIVNELSENLIDVFAFLNSNSSQMHTPTLSYSIHSNSTEFDKQFPNVLSNDEKQKLLDEINSLDSDVRDACKIELKGSLYLDF